MSVDSQLIRKLVALGRARDLHDILIGISPYCQRGDLTTTKREPHAEGLAEINQHRIGVVWTLAIHHLNFISLHGTDIQEYVDGNIVQYSHPQEFEEWLSLGSPGLSEDALDEYLKDHPL